MPEHDQTVIPKKSAPRLNRRTIVFIACVGLSGLFWILTALSKDFVEVIKIPISYKNVPTDRVVVDELTTHLDAEVKIYGFDLLWYWLSFEKIEVPINADPNNLRRVKRDGERVHIFLTDAQKSNVVADFDEQFQMLKLSPDTLFFKYRPLYKKLVPIKLEAKMEFKKQYGMIEKPVLSPDSVLVSGLKELIDTINYVSTESEQWKNLDESITTTLKLLSPENRLIELSVEEIELELNVIEFTEGKLSIPVEIHGVNNDRVKLYPNSVEVTYMVPLTQYDVVQANQFKVQVDLSGSKWKDLSRLSVSVTDYPEGIKQIRVHPPQVEFIIQN